MAKFKSEIIWEYDSQEECSAATGIPVNVIKAAKLSGQCGDGFYHHRVRLGPLLKFLFNKTNDGEEPGGWGEVLKKWNAKRAETKAKREAKEVTENAWIAAAILQVGQGITSKLRQRLENEMPAILEGLEKAQIRIKLKAACDEIIRDFAALETNWKQYIESADERQAQ